MLSDKAQADVKSLLTAKTTASRTECCTHLAKYAIAERAARRRARRTGPKVTAAITRYRSLKKALAGKKYTKGVHLSAHHLAHEGVTAHSREFLASVVEMVATNPGAKIDALKLCEASPKLTSSAEGQYTLAIVARLSENDTVFGHFLDVELVEGHGVFYFTAPKAGTKVSESATEILSKYGEVSEIAKPGDALGNGATSNLLVLALAPKADQMESYFSFAEDTLGESEEGEFADDLDSEDDLEEEAEEEAEDGDDLDSEDDLEEEAEEEEGDDLEEEESEEGEDLDSEDDLEEEESEEEDGVDLEEEECDDLEEEESEEGEEEART